MNVKEVLIELESMGNAGTKKVLVNHGAKEPFFGVRVGDLKKIVKKIKKNHALSLELYATGNSDAMYLAGLIADEKKITKEQLNTWANEAYWYLLSEYTVAWIAAESNFGWELAQEWIASENEQVASAGWSTLANLVSIKQDDELLINDLRALLYQVEKTITKQKNRVRYTMNGFVIAVGSYVEVLTNESLNIAERIGVVSVDMNGTACKVPLAKDYIQKIVGMGRIGKKRKKARC